MPRKTEHLETYYRGLAADGTIVKESKYLNTVQRYMRAHPDGTIETRDLVGYYTPWTKMKKEGTRAAERAENDLTKRFGPRP